MYRAKLNCQKQQKELQLSDKHLDRNKKHSRYIYMLDSYCRWMDLDWLYGANSFPNGTILLPNQYAAKKAANIEFARWEKCDL